MVSAAKELPRQQVVLSHRPGNLRLLALFLLPAAFFLLAFTAIPLAQAVVLSFQRWNGIDPVTWVGLRNYALLMQDENFWQAIRNTAYFTIATIIFQTSVPMVVSAVLNSGIRGSTIFRFIYFVPVIISLTITGLLWSMILEPNFGILNTMLRSLGLNSWAQLWLADKNWVMPSIILVSIWQSFGFFMMIFFAALQSVPEDLYEAAAIDGASAVQRFRFVTVPMLRRTIIVVIVLNTIGGIKSFDQIWVMTAGGPNHASETLVTYLYRTAFGTYGSSNFSVVQIRAGKSDESET
jgi:ABC-type sugar transport system permease subunit